MSGHGGNWTQDYIKIVLRPRQVETFRPLQVGTVLARWVSDVGSSEHSDLGRLERSELSGWKTFFLVQVVVVGGGSGF